MYSFHIHDLSTGQLLTCGFGFIDVKRIYAILNHYQKANPKLSLCIYIRYEEA